MAQKYDFGTLETSPPAKGSGSYDYGDLAAPAPAEDNSVPARIARTKAGMATQDNLPQPSAVGRFLNREGVLSADPIGALTKRFAGPPTQQSPHKPDERSTGEVAADQAVSAVTGIPKAVVGAAKGLSDAIGGKGDAVNAIKGAISPLTSLGTAIGSGAPTGRGDDWSQASETEGGFAGTLALGEGVKALDIPGRFKYAQPGSLAARMKAFVGIGDSGAATTGLLTKTPVGDLTSALKLDMAPEDVQLAGNALKHGEKLTGIPGKDVDSLATNESAATSDLLARRNAILAPQAGVTVPGSAARVTSVPDYDAFHSAAHPAAIGQILEKAVNGQDLNLGEIQQLNTHLNKIDSTYHNAKLTGQLKMDEMPRAGAAHDLEGLSRQMLDDGMRNNGLDGADQMQYINKHIGALIKAKVGIESLSREARQQAVQPRLQHGVTRLGTGVANTLTKNLLGGANAGVNEGIANAMRKWTGTMEFPDTPMRDTPLQPSTTAGQQHDLLPMDAGDPYASGQQSLLRQPAVTSTGIGESGATAQQAAGQSARSAPPETLAGKQQSIAENATPQSPPGKRFAQPGAFYPGKATKGQGQLFSVDQTPVKWEPAQAATSSMADLQKMSNSITEHLKSSSNGANRAQLMKDLGEINHEISRRKLAQGAGRRF